MRDFIMDYNKKILVVDDCKIIRKILLKLLAELGFNQVDGTGSPKDALVLLRTINYELVLIDWHMPEMEGLELFEQMKQDPKISNTIKAVMITGENNREKVLKAIKAGVHGYIVKPPQKDKFLEQLKKLW